MCSGKALQSPSIKRQTRVGLRLSPTRSSAGSWHSRLKMSRPWLARQHRLSGSHPAEAGGSSPGGVYRGDLTNAGAAFGAQVEHGRHLAVSSPSRELDRKSTRLNSVT